MTRPKTRPKPLDGELVDPATLEPWPGNPRRGDVEAIKRSVRANGWVGAIVARPSDRKVLIGNHRRLAALELGVETVPVLWRECDDEQAARIVIADNRTSDLAGWDEPALTGLLEQLADTGTALEGTGYDEAELVRFLAKVRPDPPPGFPGVDETPPSGHECPRCGFAWD